MGYLNVRILIAAAMVFGLCRQAAAQGFGYFSAGPAIGRFQNVQGDLQQYQFYGSELVLPTAGISLGGTGMAIVNSELLIGGNGFAALYGDVHTNRGSASMSAAAGLFNLGYALHNKDNWLLYPYVGVGYSSTTLELSNSSNTAYAFSASHSLKPGEEQKYTASGIALEGGFGLKRMVLRNNRNSGLLFGIDFGTYGIPRLQSWEHSGTEITAISSSHTQAYYVRFCFGGIFTR